METTLPSDWPFALDILKKQYDALPSQRVLAFQSQYFDEIGPNMRLGLFGQEGYMTTDPKNIESILSTRFEGRRPNFFVESIFNLKCLGLPHAHISFEDGLLMYSLKRFELPRSIFVLWWMSVPLFIIGQFLMHFQSLIGAHCLITDC